MDHRPIPGLLLLSLLAAVSLPGQTNWPASPDTSSTLLTDTNLSRGYLSAPVRSTDTVLLVTSTANIVPNSEILIDFEAVKVLSINGLALTVVRGFDSTIAAPHAQLSVIRRGGAYYHNALVSAIVALQSTPFVSVTTDPTAGAPCSPFRSIEMNAANGRLTGCVGSSPATAVWTPVGGGGGGGGGVSSVALVMPAIFSVSGSPVTTFGTLQANLASQSANLVFASPNGTSGVPSFRSLVAADVPVLNQDTTGVASSLSGILAIAHGGTGTTTPGLVAGSNVTITGSWPNQTVTSSSTGALAFSALTGSTNTGQALVLGNGSSLATTGTGAITATAVPYTGITGGPSLVAGAGITVTGTWPNQTIAGTVGAGATIPNTTNLIKGSGAGNGADSAIDPATVVTTANGLTLSQARITGLGPLATGTSASSLTTGTLAAALLPSTPSLVAGSNVTITGTWPNQTITAAPGGSPPGSVTNSLQVNNAGSFGGVINASATKGYLTQASSAGASFQLVPIPLADVATPTLTASAPLTSSGSWPSQAFGCLTASGSQAGCLSAADYTAFSAKQAAGSYLTGLAGDVAATGPGLASSALAVVNSTPGSCGANATSVCNVTSDGKGRIISQAAIPITFPANGITALTGDVLATGPGSVAGTLSTVNSSPGACGTGTSVCSVTTDAKGRVIAQTPTAITFPTNATTLQTIPVLAGTPTTNQVLQYNGTQWAAQTIGSFAGNALQLQGKDISSTAPTDTQVLAYSSGATAWQPTTIPILTDGWSVDRSTGAIDFAQVPTLVTGTTDTVSSADCAAGVKRYTNASQVAVAIAQAGVSIPAKCVIELDFEGAGGGLLTPSTSTIAGASSLTVAGGTAGNPATIVIRSDTASSGCTVNGCYPVSHRGGSASVSVPGSSGQFIYNNAGSFGAKAIALTDIPTVSKEVIIPVASCIQGVPNSALDLQSTSLPTPVCYGTSYPFGTLDFADAANSFAYLHLAVPAGFSSMDLDFLWFVNGTSQAVKWTVATVCIAAGADELNPTFNAAQTVSQTSGGTANTLNAVALTGMTATGCSPSNELILKIGRDTTDTSTLTISLKTLRFRPHFVLQG